MTINKQILHIDLNHCYAQIEEMLYPDLRNVAMAVGGSEENRHGIILAKNDVAKTYNIKTGESLREALQKCPNLLIIPPDYKTYIYYTNRVKSIYKDFSDKVESFGIDEAWVDVSESQKIFGNNAFKIAKQIQQRIFSELGLSVSIGLSWNKIYAKLGSDMDKQMGLVHITKDNYQEIVFPQAVEELLYVGVATKAKLNALNIYTIGDLATFDKIRLTKLLGKMGSVIHDFANGNDRSFVPSFHCIQEVKSVGNSITTKHDITNYEEAEAVFYVLAESVSSRLRDQKLKGRTITISLRDIDLTNYGTKQISIDESINTSDAIMQHVKMLLSIHYDFNKPLRSIGISVSNLEDENIEKRKQLSLFDTQDDLITSDKQLRLDKAIDNIRSKYGFDIIKRANVLLHNNITDFNPKDDHTIHPESYCRK